MKTEPTPAAVYALVDPESQAIRYIGFTINPKRRLYYHCRADLDTHRDRWVRALARRKLQPKMHIIRWTRSVEEAKFLEIGLIDFLRRKGHDLVNTTSGGDGVTAKDWTPALKRKLSRSRRGIRPSAETRAKMSAAHKGKKRTEEHKAKIRAAWTTKKRKAFGLKIRGRVVSQETRELLRQRTTAYISSPKARKRLSDALKGHVISKATREKISNSLYRYFAARRAE